jgi:peptidyl-dipeptidase Dcp
MGSLATAELLVPAGSGLAAFAEQPAGFGPANPFYAESTLPFHAPPFDRIRDDDYQPAIEAGMQRELAEVERIAANPAPPTFENTIVALERSGRLLDRAERAFDGVSEANTNAKLQAVKRALAPKLAAHHDAIVLNERLFKRIAAVYDQRESLHLDPESLRLLEIVHRNFVHEGARLSSADKQRLRQLNQEISTLSSEFSNRLLEATKKAAYHTHSAADLTGLSEAQIAAAAQAARDRHADGYVVPLQNTTQQPDLQYLTRREVRATIFRRSWERAEHGDANDTRAIIARMARLRAERAQLLGYPNHAAWKLADQMAKTPARALDFLGQLAPLAVGKAAGDQREMQKLIDAQQGGFQLAPWDWELYSEQLRKARYDLDESEVKPYFELDRVLQNGVFFAAHELYGVSFRERHDIPVYHPDVRVFEVFDTDGKPLALFYADYFKRDNKSGGAWMSTFVHPSRLLGDLAVVYNVANLPKPAPGEPALISFDNVTTMFHEFGHALHAMFSTTRYPTLSGTTPERDFVEFPSQFNEHWALDPKALANYARHYRTGQPMPEPLVDKIKRSRNFDEGYSLTEIIAAAELDMQWHILPASAPLQDPDRFEQQALEKTHLRVPTVPPRYRSSYFLHIWANGYSAGYYAYVWTQMLADDAFQWFDEHGGLTRANGQRFRAMILSRGDSVDLDRLYEDWRGAAPSVNALIKYRGLSGEPGSAPPTSGAQ